MLLRLPIKNMELSRIFIKNRRDAEVSHMAHSFGRDLNGKPAAGQQKFYLFCCLPRSIVEVAWYVGPRRIVKIRSSITHFEKVHRNQTGSDSEQGIGSPELWGKRTIYSRLKLLPPTGPATDKWPMQGQNYGDEGL